MQILSIFTPKNVTIWGKGCVNQTAVMFSQCMCIRWLCCTLQIYYRLFVNWSEVKITQSCRTLCDPMDCSWNSPGQNTGVGSLSLLQGIFPTYGSNPGFPHCRWTLYQLSHQGSPRIMEWVAYSFSSRSSRLRNQTGSPSLQADSLPTELSGKPICQLYLGTNGKI